MQHKYSFQGHFKTHKGAIWGQRYGAFTAKIYVKLENYQAMLWFINARLGSPLYHTV